MSQHLRHHQTQSSQTLIRRAVRRPGPVSQSALRSDQSRHISRPAGASLAPKLSAGSVESHRLARAHKVAKSRLISRFSASIFKPS